MNRCLTLLLMTASLGAQTLVLLDTDIGDDIDDAFALALAVRSPEIDLVGVTTVFKDAHTRALIALRLLEEAGRTDVPVAAGAPPQTPPETKGQFQYARGKSAKRRPEVELAPEFLYRKLKERPGQITIVAVGPLSNIAALFTRHPDSKSLLKRLVIMGGSVRTGYRPNSPPETEWNIRCDIPAARVVFTSGVPLVVAPLDATIVKLEADGRARIFGSGALGRSLETLYRLWGKPTPTLFDPVAVTLVYRDSFTTMERLRLAVDDKGLTREIAGAPNAQVATAIRTQEFLDWYVSRLAHP